MGLVTRLVSQDDLIEEAMNGASRLARSDPYTVAATKTALRLGQDLPLPQALNLETRLAAGVAG